MAAAAAVQFDFARIKQEPRSYSEPRDLRMSELFSQPDQTSSHVSEPRDLLLLTSSNSGRGRVGADRTLRGNRPNFKKFSLLTQNPFKILFKSFLFDPASFSESACELFVTAEVGEPLGLSGGLQRVTRQRLGGLGAGVDAVEDDDEEEERESWNRYVERESYELVPAYG
ncbi:unnamed protein product [Cyprideis torosa]|uniref:Uncharacterized protein n=1 Tax=Cyprideis torosa TaxID=163714 RepID=A0A7R8ZR38_9CRUS|nr:unnamed protein product [Cyprideis torosa]CAG0892120.1 unnamed protein product [Cyprideis torosa]